MFLFFDVLSSICACKMEIPIKPSRKKLDVQVHKERPNDGESNIKTFAANHPAYRRSKHRYVETIEEEKLNEKLSRRHMMKENEKLNGEIVELQEKLTSMDMYINRKNAKFKEKLTVLQQCNEELGNQNVILRNQCQEVMAQLRACQNELEISKNCQNCEELTRTIHKQNNDYAMVKRSNIELDEDVNMLKNVVYRLNVQLERYQQKLQKSNIPNRSPTLKTPTEVLPNVRSTNMLSESHRGHSHTPISWGKVNVHTLGPLLDGYQDTLNEKDEIIQQYEDQLSTFTEKMREIIKENETLHKSLLEDDDCSQVLSVEMEKLKEEVKSLKDQNDLLIKKCAMKQNKIDEILKCYEQKVEQMKRDYKVLHEEYCKSRSEVAGLKEKNKALLDDKDSFKNERDQYIPLAVHNASVNECKKWYEELKRQYDQEKSKLRETIDQLSKQVLEANEKCSTNTKDRTDCELKLKNAEKQIKKLETKYLELQHTLNEVQLSRSACRKQLHKAMGFARDLVAEQETLLTALNQRHQENKAVKKIGSDIASRMDSLRSQLKSVQQEAFQELTTVEQKIQDQDSIIDALKNEHLEEVERLKLIIKEKEEKNILFKENTSAIPMPHYLLFRDKALQQ